MLLRPHMIPWFESLVNLEGCKTLSTTILNLI